MGLYITKDRLENGQEFTKFKKDNCILNDRFSTADHYGDYIFYKTSPITSNSNKTTYPGFVIIRPYTLEELFDLKCNEIWLCYYISWAAKQKEIDMTFIEKISLKIYKTKSIQYILLLTRKLISNNIKSDVKKYIEYILENNDQADYSLQLIATLYHNKKALANYNIDYNEYTKRLEQHLINLDTTGEICSNYIRGYHPSDFKLFENAILGKNKEHKNGHYLFQLLYNNKNSNKEKVIEMILSDESYKNFIMSVAIYIEKDSKLKDKYMPEVRKSTIRYDKTGELIYKYATEIDDSNINELWDAINKCEDDKEHRAGRYYESGYWKREFYKLYESKLDKKDSMKEIKNPYNYDLTKFDTIMIDENGKILGVANYTTCFNEGEIYMLTTGNNIKILKEKRLVVVEEIKK